MAVAMEINVAVWAMVGCAAMEVARFVEFFG
jgi:hypothetical protein